METVIIILFLAVLSGLDLWKKQIPLWFLLASIIGAVILQLCGVFHSKMECFRFSYDWVLGGMFGVLLLGIGKITKEALGYADGMAVIVLGIIMGLCCVLEVFFFGLCLSAVYASFLFVVRKTSGKTRFAFLPFLAGGYIIWMLI